MKILNSRFQIPDSNKLGITLLETLLVIGVLAILAVTGFGIYRNYSKNVELESNASAIISDLKGVQSKAMNGEGGLKWGIDFINETSDYYEIFSTATDYAARSVKRKVYISDMIAFSDPTEDFSKDIIFNKIRGTIIADTTIKIKFESTERIITITALGNIY